MYCRRSGKKLCIPCGARIECDCLGLRICGLNKINKLAKVRGVGVITELHDLAKVEWMEQEWNAIVHIFGHLPKPVFNKTFEGIKTASLWNWWSK